MAKRVNKIIPKKINSNFFINLFIKSSETTKFGQQEFCL